MIKAFNDWFEIEFKKDYPTMFGYKIVMPISDYSDYLDKKRREWIDDHSVCKKY